VAATSKIRFMRRGDIMQGNHRVGWIRDRFGVIRWQVLIIYAKTGRPRTCGTFERLKDAKSAARDALASGYGGY